MQNPKPQSFEKSGRFLYSEPQLNAFYFDTIFIQ